MRIRLKASMFFNCHINPYPAFPPDSAIGNQLVAGMLLTTLLTMITCTFVKIEESHTLLLMLY